MAVRVEQEIKYALGQELSKHMFEGMKFVENNSGPQTGLHLFAVNKAMLAETLRFSYRVSQSMQPNGVEFMLLVDIVSAEQDSDLFQYLPPFEWRYDDQMSGIQILWQCGSCGNVNSGIEHACHICMKLR